ncbi:Ig-like domain-containing protein [Lactococcus lactis]|uniref:Ig-like domain-containing protein n=1 Tax=Lactococcus lactis TaxID=1358 RepID=UPI00265A2B80|nr:Ig-like domain-containing protein [Lactococcus lactis]WKF72351.1 Ig-like domain-containing protein [Lactococcus lactis]
MTIAGNIHTGTIDTSGNHVISLSKTYAVNSSITVTQEKDGIMSDPATAKVVAPEQLGLPTLNTVTDQDTTVTRTATAGATVHLSINGFNFQTIASANGDFSIDIEKNYPANTPIEVYQELNGIKSQTAEFCVQLTSNFIINKIKSNATSITGTGHPNAQITVQIHDEVFTGTIDGSGNFNINLQGATFKVGTDVKIPSVSSEGTETKTVPIYPRDPVIGVIFVADDEIRGTADPGATVIITVGSTQYQTTAESNGNFRQSVNPNLVVSGAVVTIYSTINGYESEKESKAVS